MICYEGYKTKLGQFVDTVYPESERCVHLLKKRRANYYYVINHCLLLILKDTEIEVRIDLLTGRSIQGRYDGYINVSLKGTRRRMTITMKSSVI